MHISVGQQQTHGAFYQTLVLFTVPSLGVDAPRKARSKGKSVDSFRRRAGKNDAPFAFQQCVGPTTQAIALKTTKVTAGPFFESAITTRRTKRCGRSPADKQVNSPARRTVHQLRVQGDLEPLGTVFALEVHERSRSDGSLHLRLHLRLRPRPAVLPLSLLLPASLFSPPPGDHAWKTAGNDDSDSGAITTGTIRRCLPFPTRAPLSLSRRGDHIAGVACTRHTPLPVPRARRNSPATAPGKKG